MRKSLSQRASCFVGFSGSFCSTNFWIHFGPQLEPFWEPFLGPGRPERGQDGTKKAKMTFKIMKTCFCKNLETHLVFSRFLVSKAVRDSLERRKKAPKRHLKVSRTLQKGILKRSHKGTPKNIYLGSERTPGPEGNQKRNPKRSSERLPHWSNSAELSALEQGVRAQKLYGCTKGSV